MDYPVDRTIIVFCYTTEQEDRVFRYAQHLEGEALHSLLDALVDELYEPDLSTTIYVVHHDGEGNFEEEEIRFEIA